MKLGTNMNDVKNCKIVSTKLEFYQEYIDSKLMIMHLILEGDGWGCAFGGVILDQADDGDFLKKTIKGILICLKVPTWESLTGTFIRAEVEGIGRGVPTIGHLLENRWFTFRDSFLTVDGKIIKL